MLHGLLAVGLDLGVFGRGLGFLSAGGSGAGSSEAQEEEKAKESRKNFIHGETSLLTGHNRAVDKTHGLGLDSIGKNGIFQ
jgi:hypothetical protein